MKKIKIADGILMLTMNVEDILLKNMGNRKRRNPKLIYHYREKKQQ